MVRKIKYLVICGSGTSQTASLSHVHAYWCDELYLQHPSFHYIICPDGKTVQMLGLAQIAGGPEAHNRHSVNIAYIGGIDEEQRTTDNRTPAQKTAMLKLLRELKAQFPEAGIRGYHELITNDNNMQEAVSAISITGDPGFDVKAAYKHV